jgi:energy-converting hydrogenase Eha subunit C
MEQAQKLRLALPTGKAEQAHCKSRGRVFPMFMLRAAGSMLLIYALFNAAVGLNRQELPWLISAFLLAIGGIALILAQPRSRIVVLATAVAAAVIGAISQVRMILGFLLEMAHRLARFAKDVVLPVQQLLLEIGELTLVHELFVL